MYTFLERARLSRYAETFEAQGFTDLEYLRMMERTALYELLVGEYLELKIGHAKKFIDYLQNESFRDLM